MKTIASFEKLFLVQQHRNVRTQEQNRYASDGHEPGYSVDYYVTVFRTFPNLKVVLGKEVIAQDLLSDSPDAVVVAPLAVRWQTCWRARVKR
ncbi:hypothetical protein ACFLVN_05290 [Chloroflexota bacterium]